MSFFAILLALVLEQARPMTAESRVFKLAAHWVDWVARTLDAGVRHQAWVAWGITVLVPAVLVMVMHWLLILSLGWLAAVLWNVALLYVTLGFRQFSHHFTAIRDALEDGDEARARELTSTRLTMGQKTHPTGFRLGVIRSWDSRWFREKGYAEWLHEDLSLRKYSHDKLKSAGFSPEQAETVVRVIAEAQDELVTKKDLEIAFAPVKSDLSVLKWAVGLNTVLCLLILGKLFTN